MDFHFIKHLFIDWSRVDYLWCLYQLFELFMMAPFTKMINWWASDVTSPTLFQ